eukprot:TRINITY_DN15876_c0_g1_i2.p1 TRINITY_DN15876_c0_g1~~TRINITY_DN15876_c0_g1_i2.p1  ORF type:complete len:363 (-),score=40.53 TRINITY_DN15876_c0_g1_i2:14-1102(-)
MPDLSFQTQLLSCLSCTRLDAGVRTKLLAGAGLVCVSTSVGVLYKASQAATGGFRYSTTSAICIADFIKLSMSSVFHILDKSHRRDGVSPVRTGIRSATEQLSCSAATQIWILSFLYAVNNQLSFYAYTLADPGTIFLFKAASTMIVALMQSMFYSKSFSLDQWKAISLQACGMIIVQYDGCKGTGVYSPFAYICMSISTCITAISAAQNEHLVKTYTVSLNVQNATLYAGGLIMNLIAFHLVPNPNSNGIVGFFEGYDNLLAIGVVVSNSCMGLAINAVYKYADAIVKCIASDVTAVILVLISSLFFDFNATLTTWCGVFVVVFAVHLYIEAAAKTKPAAKLEEPEKPSTSESDDPRRLKC